MHHHHAGMSMDGPADPALQAKLEADRKESEFNHHFAGFLVVLAGVFILFEERLTSRWPGFRYSWPLCFLLSGLFVLVFSDTELWPFGPKNWWVGVTGNLEVAQHKAFAVILLLLGTIEYRRAKGTLAAAWSAWVFPLCALAGSVMLLFHAHDAGAHGPGAMSAMHLIQMQHLSYAAMGAGIAFSKGLADAPVRGRGFFRLVWPVLTMVLGVVLMLYKE